MDQTPKNIGRYEVDRLLGAGAMGYVYLARDPKLDRAVAIKTIRFQSLSGDSLSTFLERFRNEARAAAKLHHPHIVQVYDVGEEDETGPYLVFEYVPGSSLKELLRARGALDPKQICRFADEIASALSAAHQQGIIHRDIKPDNLLMTEDDHIKLADFGIARLPNADLTRDGQFLGTPCYAAPETLTKGYYGPETDLFSMATVVYECVTGVRAFTGDDAIIVAHQVIHTDPARPSSVAKGRHVPAEVDEVLSRAISKSNEKRYSSPNAFARALRNAYENADMLAAQAVPQKSTLLPTSESENLKNEKIISSTFLIVSTLAIIVFGSALIYIFHKTSEPIQDSDASVQQDSSILLNTTEPQPLRPQRTPSSRTKNLSIADTPSINSAPPTISPISTEPLAPTISPPPSSGPAPQLRENADPGTP